MHFPLTGACLVVARFQGAVIENASRSCIVSLIHITMVIGIFQLNCRGLELQIEYWARLGKAVEDNPELPFQCIKDTLLAVAEANENQLSVFKV